MSKRAAATQHSLKICMGSSCFCRGNNRNVEVIQAYLRQTGKEGRVRVEGHLCQGQCTGGPNLAVDGRAYTGVDPVSLLGVLGRHLNDGG